MIRKHVSVSFVTNNTVHRYLLRQLFIWYSNSLIIMMNIHASRGNKYMERKEILHWRLHLSVTGTCPMSHYP